MEIGNGRRRLGNRIRLEVAAHIEIAKRHVIHCNVLEFLDFLGEVWPTLFIDRNRDDLDSFGSELDPTIHQRRVSHGERDGDQLEANQLPEDEGSTPPSNSSAIPPSTIDDASRTRQISARSSS